MLASLAICAVVGALSVVALYRLREAQVDLSRWMTRRGLKMSIDTSARLHKMSCNVNAIGVFVALLAIATGVMSILAEAEIPATLSAALVVMLLAFVWKARAAADVHQAIALDRHRRLATCDD